MGGFVTILASSIRGDLERRQVPTRVAAFRAARDLITECMAREAQHGWLHNEVVSIRVEADPDQP
jgi:hypothetical protein